MKTHKEYLSLAVEEALKGIGAREGGPFGAVIVRDGQILGRGHNRVLCTNDPTAHAEICAIRKACEKLKTPHLTGAVLYTNFEPCPMCLAAVYWAHIRQIYYCSGREIAEKIGFMDRHLYEEFRRPSDQREMQSKQIQIPEMEHLLEEWNSLEDNLQY